VCCVITNESGTASLLTPAFVHTCRCSMQAAAEHHYVQCCRWTGKRNSTCAVHAGKQHANFIFSLNMCWPCRKAVAMSPTWAVDAVILPHHVIRWGPSQDGVLWSVAVAVGCHITTLLHRQALALRAWQELAAVLAARRSLLLPVLPANGYVMPCYVCDQGFAERECRGPLPAVCCCYCCLTLLVWGLAQTASSVGSNVPSSVYTWWLGTSTACKLQHCPSLQRQGLSLPRFQSPRPLCTRRWPIMSVIYISMCLVVLPVLLAAYVQGCRGRALGCGDTQPMASKKY
jgi:hypothetical protein